MFDVLKSFCLTNHLQKGQISMSIMKCFIIKEHIVINDSLIYIQYKNAKSNFYISTVPSLTIA